MSKLLYVLLASISISAFADQFVQGYLRKDGVYVAPHFRSSPNNTTLDNYSTHGNINPHTGQTGYVAPNYQAPFTNRESGYDPRLNSGFAR
jgi:hypothetical protein